MYALVKLSLTIWENAADKPLLGGTIPVSWVSAAGMGWLFWPKTREYTKTKSRISANVEFTLK